ncbi:MAG: NAD(P)-dependent oxidoreductase [Chloroflexi bacterium]|nr:NAD(P)-dependent oxidoreductase [Chloroflexota bacterium]
MQVMVFGATGAIGRPLVAMLRAAGHEVVGTTRSVDRAEELRAAGVEPVVVDAFDAGSVLATVAAARPDVIINQLTDLAAGFDDASLRRNARLRIIGTRNIVEAMLAAGVRRLLAQSAAWLYAPADHPRTEDDPLRSVGVDDAVLPGIVELERLTLTTPGVDGIVLRYGFLYGPGTVSDRPQDRPPVHVAAAARAASLAIDRGGPGIYNVVDDGADVSNTRSRNVLGWAPTER